METAVIVAIIAASGVILTAVATAVGAWFGRRSQSNEQIVTVDVNGLLDRVTALEEELAQVRGKLADLERAEQDWETEVEDRDKRIADLEERVERLETWIRAQGADPEQIVKEGQ